MVDVEHSHQILMESELGLGVSRVWSSWPIGSKRGDDLLDVGAAAAVEFELALCSHLTYRTSRCARAIVIVRYGSAFSAVGRWPILVLEAAAPADAVTSGADASAVAEGLANVKVSPVMLVVVFEGTLYPASTASTYEDVSQNMAVKFEALSTDEVSVARKG